MRLQSFNWNWNGWGFAGYSSGHHWLLTQESLLAPVTDSPPSTCARHFLKWRRRNHIGLLTCYRYKHDVLIPRVFFTKTSNTVLLKKNNIKKWLWNNANSSSRFAATRCLASKHFGQIGWLCATLVDDNLVHWLSHLPLINRSLTFLSSWCSVKLLMHAAEERIKDLPLQMPAMLGFQPSSLEIEYSSLTITANVSLLLTTYVQTPISAYAT